MESCDLSSAALKIKPGSSILTMVEPASRGCSAGRRSLRESKICGLLSHVVRVSIGMCARDDSPQDSFARAQWGERGLKAEICRGKRCLWL